VYTCRSIRQSIHLPFLPTQVRNAIRSTAYHGDISSIFFPDEFHFHSVSHELYCPIVNNEQITRNLSDQRLCANKDREMRSRRAAKVKVHHGMFTAETVQKRSLAVINVTRSYVRSGGLVSTSNGLNSVTGGKKS